MQILGGFNAALFGGVSPWDRDAVNAVLKPHASGDGIQVGGSAQLNGPFNQINGFVLTMGAQRYATSSSPLGAGTTLALRAYAWNGTDGQTINGTSTLLTRMLSATQNDCQLEITVSSFVFVKAHGATNIWEQTGQLWASRPGSGNNDQTQDTLRIQPGSPPSPFYRGLTTYAYGGTTPVCWTDQNGYLFGPTPTNAAHFATKAYVDANAGGASVWGRSGTTLSPTTPGDRVLANGIGDAASSGATADGLTIQPYTTPLTNYRGLGVRDSLGNLLTEFTKSGALFFHKASTDPTQRISWNDGFAWYTCDSSNQHVWQTNGSGYRFVDYAGTSGLIMAYGAYALTTTFKQAASGTGAFSVSFGMQDAFTGFAYETGIADAGGGENIVNNAFALRSYLGDFQFHAPSLAYPSNRTSLVARITSTGRIYTKGDFACDNSAKGVVLQSPNLHYWRVTIGNTGVLTTTDLGTTLPA